MPELLIVGGLTLDRFADGTTAPGGSVIHSGRAAVADGSRPSFLTVAGEEPEAALGVEGLRAMGEVTLRRSARTTTFAHAESKGRRVLTLEARSDPIAGPFAGDAPDVALLAPIADELPAAAVVELQSALRPRVSICLIQGWLRRLAVGEPVHPLPLDEVAPDLWAAFADADAIVVSTEDLAEAPQDPFAQAAAVRRCIGPRPLLVLTLGAEGYLLDDPAIDRVTASVPRRIVAGVPMVGAGDTFGAILALGLGRGAPPSAAADGATEGVIRMLESRI